MARVKGALATRKRRNKTLKLAKGYWGGKSRLFKTAKEAVWKSNQYAYISRRLKKRDFRKLWITRITAGCKQNGMNYSTFMDGLKKSNIALNRKMLSEIAINDPAGFTKLCETAKKAREDEKKAREVEWNNKITTACKMNGIDSETLINGLKKAEKRQGVTLSTKKLAAEAVENPAEFAKLCKKAQAALQ